jgi:hypothetical protein
MSDKLLKELAGMESRLDPEELLQALKLNRSVHEPEPEQKSQPRILIVGCEMVGRTLARRMLEGMKRNDFGHFGPAIVLTDPRKATERYDFSLRELAEEPRFWFGDRRDYVLRTDSSNLREIMRLSLERSNRVERNRGPAKHGRHSRWR